MRAGRGLEAKERAPGERKAVRAVLCGARHHDRKPCHDYEIADGGRELQRKTEAETQRLAELVALGKRVEAKIDEERQLKKWRVYACDMTSVGPRSEFMFWRYSGQMQTES